MKWTTTSAIIGTVLLVTAFTLKLAGYEVSEPYEPKITCAMYGCDGTCIVCRHPEPNDTKLINGIECKKHGSGWQPIKSFCPKCGDFSPWSNNCTMCGTKNYKGDYMYVCPNNHSTYTTDPYCNKCGGRTTLKNTEPKLTYTAEELNEIYKDEPALGRLAKSLWEVDEPNEPEIITIEHPMLQEGYTFYIWEPNDIAVVSLDFIPTWPDYIELEKELIIGHTKFVNPNGSIGDHYGIVLDKGTKIYFKGDD